MEFLAPTIQIAFPSPSRRVYASVWSLFFVIGTETPKRKTFLPEQHKPVGNELHYSNYENN